MKISVWITCDNGTAKHALKSKNYHKNLSSSNNELEFNALCINKTNKETLNKLIADEFKIHIVDTKGKGSLQHGIAIQKALNIMCKDNINIISDADATVIKKNWDNDIVELHENYDCVGIQNPNDTTRYNVKTGKQTWLGTPVPQWISLKNGIDWRGLNPLPDKSNKRQKFSNDDIKNIFGINEQGRTLLRDTMYEIPLFLDKNNLNSFVFDGPFFHKTPESKLFFNKPEFHTDDEFLYKGEPIVTHSRGCRNRGKDAFWNVVESYVKTL